MALEVHIIVIQRFMSLFRVVFANLINLLRFIDFKKAFDMIDQALLLYKLGNYGLSNNALSLLAHYFYDRYQMTVINGV